jgi:hypothetical protein
MISVKQLSRDEHRRAVAALDEDVAGGDNDQRERDETTECEIETDHNDRQNHGGETGSFSSRCDRPPSLPASACHLLRSSSPRRTKKDHERSYGIIAAVTLLDASATTTASTTIVPTRLMPSLLRGSSRRGRFTETS